MVPMRRTANNRAVRRDKYLALPKDVVGDDAQRLSEIFARELGRSFHVRG